MGYRRIDLHGHNFWAFRGVLLSMPGGALTGSSGKSLVTSSDLLALVVHLSFCGGRCTFISGDCWRKNVTPKCLLDTTREIKDSLKTAATSVEDYVIYVCKVKVADYFHNSTMMFWS